MPRHPSSRLTGWSWHPSPWSSCSSSRGREGLVEIVDDVLNILDADGQPHNPRQDAGVDELLLGELRVRRRGGVDDERLRVADVGEVAREVYRLDELLADGATALHLEAEHRARPLGQVLLRP